VPSLSKQFYFTSFTSPTDHLTIPEHFVLTRDGTPHLLCRLAAEELQLHLRTQKAWIHNFGLTEHDGSVIIGKMFGVLVVQTSDHQLGYLAAFSGKLAGGNNHAKFVPPVFDSLTENSFLNLGMEKLTLMNKEIKDLTSSKSEVTDDQINSLKAARKNHSVSLQRKLFNQYYFLNKAGVEKSMYDIFRSALRKNPPSGAGECAAPKLLQYAFKHQMKPLALAEFWWGQSPKSEAWKHGHYYPTCSEKCGPILAHMLSSEDIYSW
jgi:tRNA pseudouridine32 synthase / 23S rRNA pseudouridine746 synthase